MERTVLGRLHFDGTRFAGWQRQRSERTVQGELEAVLQQLCGRRVVVHAAGRTDAGVHAVGMAISATVPERWTPDALRRAINALLPEDCWLEAVREVRAGFHARKSATARSYQYRIGTDAASRSPFRHPFEWSLSRQPDRSLLDQSAALVTGCHDFRALAVQTGQKRNCQCTVREARWVSRPDAQGYTFHITADRFLHHLVRMLVGTMCDIALERRPVGHLAALLSGQAGVRSSPPAPPQGLYFVAAEYPARWFADEPDLAV